MADTANFHMVIEDTFYLESRGPLFTGKVLSGILHNGDKIIIITQEGSQITTSVTEIEMFHKRLDLAGPGDYIGVCMKKEDVTKPLLFTFYGGLVYRVGEEAASPVDLKSNNLVEPLKFKKEQSVPGVHQSEKNEAIQEETHFTTCMDCRKQTPLPKQNASWGSAIICINCNAPLIRPANPDEPSSVSPEMLKRFYGVIDRGLEHPVCPFCHRINYAIIFPAKGMSLGWYAVSEPENPSGFRFKIVCVNCSKDFYVEWNENPF